MAYLTAREITELSTTVTYKPGFQFTIMRHPIEGLCLRIVFNVPDAYRPGEQQTQGVNAPIPPLYDARHFHDWLLWRLRIIELHELCEFYRVNGELLYDPHSLDYWVPEQ